MQKVVQNKSPFWRRYYRIVGGHGETAILWKTELLNEKQRYDSWGLFTLATSKLAAVYVLLYIQRHGALNTINLKGCNVLIAAIIIVASVSCTQSTYVQFEG